MMNIPSKEYVIGYREDLIDNYVGFTRLKTQKFLNDNKDKVIIIDEAYNICLINKNDDFGKESLDCIKAYANKHPEHKIILIFYRIFEYS